MAADGDWGFVPELEQQNLLQQVQIQTGRRERRGMHARPIDSVKPTVESLRTESRDIQGSI
jgi:hypothetical protein